VENKKITLLEVLRWVPVALAVVMLILMFGSDPISDADPLQVEAAVTESLNMENMQKGDNQMIKRLYGLDPSVYECMVLYYPLTNMEAEELLIVKLADLSQAETVEAAIRARIEAQKNSFDGYGLEQYDMLSHHAVVEVRGNYILFVVDAEADAALDAFLDAL